MPGSRKFELEIGFDFSTPPHSAKAAAHERWLAAVARDGAQPVGDPTVIMRHSKGLDLDGIGQYAVVVSGEVTDGD